MRSTRASCDGSVRWLLSNNRNVPSGAQATPVAFALARKLTGLASPPADGTTETLVEAARAGAEEGDPSSVRRPRERMSHLDRVGDDPFGERALVLAVGVQHA